MINPVDDGARNTLSDSMGIFNAISGTPTSAHGSTTILWYSQTHTFITTKDWLNYLQVKRKQFGHILRQPEAIIHCFFFSLSLFLYMPWAGKYGVHSLLSVGPLFLFPMETPVNTVDFQALRIHLLPDSGHLSFCIACFILWKMGLRTCDGSASVYPILWLAI